MIYKKPKIPPIWNTIRKIQTALQLDEIALADMMCMTHKDFLRYRRTNRDLKVSSGMALCNSIHLGFNNFVLGKIDYKALAHHFSGETLYIPEKYTVFANSKKRTVINLLNYIELRFGIHTRQQLLRDYQMSETMFKDPDGPINLRFSVDITRWILKFHKNKEILIDMGKHSVNTHRYSPLGRELRRAQHLPELFEMMLGHGGAIEKHIEKNFLWRIHSMNRDKCIIDGVPNQEIVESIGKKYAFHRSVCLIREGFAASIPCYLGYQPAPLKQIKCVSEGDRYMRFQLDLEAIKHTKKKLSGFFFS